MESSLAYSYLEESSFTKAVDCLEEELFKSHSDVIIKDVPVLVKDFPQSAETLRTLFEIIQQTDLTKKFANAFGAYINQTGLDTLNKVQSSMNEQTLSSYIDQIIALRVQTDAVLRECFKDLPLLKQ